MYSFAKLQIYINFIKFLSLNIKKNVFQNANTEYQDKETDTRIKKRIQPKRNLNSLNSATMWFDFLSSSIK